MPKRHRRRDTSDTTMIAALRFVARLPARRVLPRDLAALGREQHLLELIDAALREDEFALHLQPIVSLRDDDSTQASRSSSKC